ncbi:hypothetical protein RUM44_004201 [Polyplax serrata]|uniref:Uncharacterized protein n=1 Tax=Polyplax serrata TaxID=468196 RepID=A0ABR1B256_POLSC
MAWPDAVDEIEEQADEEDLFILMIDVTNAVNGAIMQETASVTAVEVVAEGRDPSADQDPAIAAHAPEAIQRVEADPSQGTRSQNLQIADQNQTRRDHHPSPALSRDLAAGPQVMTR